MYSEALIEHFTNPRNVGVIDEPDGYGKVGSPVCGDLMEVFLRIENGSISDVKYRTFGCAAAIASSSMATEMVKGRPLSYAATVSDEQVAQALGGLSEAKMHCSNLAASALHAALEDYYAKHPDVERTE